MKIFYRVVWLSANFIFKFFCGLKKKGMDNIPLKGGVIIASNHISVYDPPLVGTASPRELFYLAKRELFEHKFLGWLIRKLNSIPVNRERFDKGTFSQAVKLLKSGKALLLFPEGTRNLGSGFLKLKPGIGMIALKSEVPIVPAIVENSQELSFNLFRRRKVMVKFGSPISWSWLKNVPADKEGYSKICDELLKRFATLKMGN
jgi:1-acyl-sn-glycerol-3-phosphate acyltransferase